MSCQSVYLAHTILIQKPTGLGSLHKKRGRAIVDPASNYPSYQALPGFVSYSGSRLLLTVSLCLYGKVYVKCCVGINVKSLGCPALGRGNNTIGSR